MAAAVRHPRTDCLFRPIIHDPAAVRLGNPLRCVPSSCLPHSWNLPLVRRARAPVLTYHRHRRRRGLRGRLLCRAGAPATHGAAASRLPHSPIFRCNPLGPPAGPFTTWSTAARHPKAARTAGPGESRCVRTSPLFGHELPAYLPVPTTPRPTLRRPDHIGGKKCQPSDPSPVTTWNPPPPYLQCSAARGSCLFIGYLTPGGGG